MKIDLFAVPNDTSVLSKAKTNEPRQRKPVFGVCDQGRHKPACTATEAS